MAIIKVKTGGITADAITDALIADDVVGTEHLTANEVDTAALGADAVTAAQLADNAISEEHLDVTAITGHTAETTVADGDLVVLHDASASALRKMTVANLVANAGGGKVLQVVTYTDNTQRSSTSSSFVTCSSTLGGAITPSASNSKILAMVHFNGSVPQASTTNTYTIYRGSTNLGDSDKGMAQINPGGGTHDTGSVVTMIYLDSPNTTNATTYQVRGKRNNSTFYINYGASLASLVLMEIGA